MPAEMRTEAMTAHTLPPSTAAISVVIATLNRTSSLLRLLRQLERQTVSADIFEVVVVDDGSTVPAAGDIARAGLALHTVVLRSERSGAAAARHRGIEAATGDVIVILDDDIQVAPDFLARHVEHHPAGSRNAVLGWIRPDPDIAMPIFERFHADVLERFADDARHG